MATATERLRENLKNYNKNPSIIIQHSLDMVEEVTDGVDILDATSPFLALLTMTAVATSAHINEAKTLNRKQYKQSAMNKKDLYRHMSDRDYVGIWSKPASTVLQMALPYEEVVNRAVEENQGDAIRSIVLPRDTSFMVDNIPLGIHYPIRIDVLPTGSIQTLYDTEVESPLQTLNTNIVDHRIVRIGGRRYINMEIPVEQYRVDSNLFSLDNMSSFLKQIPLEDNFYYARAYLQKTVNNVKQWQEILTTHSIDVYDVTTPTLVVEVVENVLVCYLPDVYMTTGQAGAAIRIDVYTTRGVMDLDLSDYGTGQFTADWRNLDTFASNALTVPLERLSQIQIYSTDSLQGGRDELSFQQLRDKVIYRVDDNKPLITNDQIRVALELDGYTIQKYIDNITDRMFVASKNMPLRTRDGLSTAVKSFNAHTLITTDNDAPGYNQSLRINGSRWTLTNDAIYKVENGLVTLAPDLTHDEFSEMNDISSVIADLNTGQYLYSPYHYVLDNNGDVFRARPYWLSGPSVPYRVFEEQNSNLSYSITTAPASIELVKPTGSNFHSYYEMVLTVTLPASVNREEILVQMKKLSADGSAYYLNGVKDPIANTPAGQIVFRFRLETNFDVNELDQLELTNFRSVNGVNNDIAVDLNGEYDIFFMIDLDINPSLAGDTSTFEGQFIHRDNNGDAINVIGASHESMTIELGKPLPYLYVPARRIVGSPVYDTYDSDVPLTYDEVVYKPDPQYGYEYTMVNGEAVLTVLHDIGDPVLSNGEPVIEHYAGEVRYVDGEPVVLEEPSIEMQVGITLFDARYRYASTRDIIDYRDNIPVELDRYMETEISSIAGRLNERTDLFFKPKGSSEDVEVYVGGGVQRTLPTELDFNVTFYMTETGYKNLGLRGQLETATRRVISEHVQRSTLTISSLYEDLKVLAGDEVVGIDMSKLGPNQDLSVLALVDEGTSFSIGETLTQLADGKLDIQDNISIQFSQIRGN